MNSLSKLAMLAIAFLPMGLANTWQDDSHALYDGPRIVLLHSATDDTQCLALPDDTPGPWQRVIMKQCQTGDKSMRWRLKFGQGTISPGVDSQPWCLDGGDPSDTYASVSVAGCDDTRSYQQWFYTDDKHLAVFDQDRCLDLKVEEGGWLQTWECSANITNQIWLPELADI